MPKQIINDIYAIVTFPEKLKVREAASTVKMNIEIDDVSSNINWFSYPEYSPRRQQIEPKCWDGDHLLITSSGGCNSILAEHLENYDANRNKAKCAYCGKKIFSKEALQIHLHRHRDTVYRYCTQCAHKRGCLPLTFCVSSVC